MTFVIVITSTSKLHIMWSFSPIGQLGLKYWKFWCFFFLICSNKTEFKFKYFVSNKQNVIAYQLIYCIFLITIPIACLAHHLTQTTHLLDNYLFKDSSFLSFRAVPSAERPSYHLSRNEAKAQLTSGAEENVTGIDFAASSTGNTNKRERAAFSSSWSKLEP